MKRGLQRALIVAAFLAPIPSWIVAQDTDLPDDADPSAAIVLGAAVHGDRPSPVFAARLDYARDLLRAGRTDTVLIAGGVGDDQPRSEAEVGETYLHARGISKDDVLVEVMSHTTYENLCHAKLILQPSELETVAIVSDPLHLPRALLIARNLGLNAVPAATPHTRYRSLGTQLPFLLRESYFFARELIGPRAPCEPPPKGIAVLTGTYVDPQEVAVVDAETVQQKLERLVAIPSHERTPLEFARTGRAMGALRTMAARGEFDAFVDCVADPRPVWPEYTAQIAGPTTLGYTCLSLINEPLDGDHVAKGGARTKGGLGLVTAENARAWWSARKAGKSLPLENEPAP